MEKFDLFDLYFNGELSAEEEKKFKDKLESDDDFASEFKVYSMTVTGICKEAEQDNTDFGVAMKNLTKEQLFDIIGRKSQPFSREAIVNLLRSRIILDHAQRTELSGAAALDDIEDDDYSEVDAPTEKNDLKKDSDNSLRRFTLLFIALIILLILLGIIL